MDELGAFLIILLQLYHTTYTVSFKTQKEPTVIPSKKTLPPKKGEKEDQDGP